VAVIPARAGSKRLPGKNTRPFFDHPMMAYGISAALGSRLFDQVMVSSDDPTVGEIAEWYGAEFVLRPPELATDNAGLVEVACHVLDTLNSRGRRPEILCQIMPNCPLVRSEDLAAHWKLFQEGRRKFQISVVRYRGVYPHWALVPDGSFRGEWLLGSKYLTRSQDLPNVFCPTGAIWIVRVEDFLAQRAFYGSPFHLAPMDANRGIDIDDQEDLSLAEVLVQGLFARDGVPPLEPIARQPFLIEGARLG